jgi:hypothetical protein
MLNLQLVQQSRVKSWGSQPLLIKPYVRFSRIRLSDVLHPGQYGFSMCIMFSVLYVEAENASLTNSACASCVCCSRTVLISSEYTSPLLKGNGLPYFDPHPDEHRSYAILGSWDSAARPLALTASLTGLWLPFPPSHDCASSSLLSSMESFAVDTLST